MNKQTINYSQCWEDYKLLDEALMIKNTDTVLSITSGGDNSLALLINSPKQIVSIDSNTTQNYLLELKAEAIKLLDNHELLEFIGEEESSDRIDVFDRLKSSLSTDAANWFSDNLTIINNGVIHEGRFEKFLNNFRRYIMPVIHSSKRIRTMQNITSIQEQRDFYNKVWNSKRWRIFFRLITSRYVLKKFARQQGMFDQAEPGAIAERYIKRLDNNFCNVSIKNNYFMNYFLTGKYGQSKPPYLMPENARVLQKNLPRLSIVNKNIFEYLKSIPDDTFTKFNLSDIFEPLTIEQNNKLWKEIIRTAKNGARIAYWNNLVIRSCPDYLSDSVVIETELADKLHNKDRVYYYDSFNIISVKK